VVSKFGVLMMETRKRMARIGQAIVLTALLAVLMVPMAASAREAQAWVFATARNYLPGEEPELGVRGQGVSDLWLDVYRFDGPAHFKNGDWGTLWNVDYRNVPGRGESALCPRSYCEQRRKG